MGFKSSKGQLDNGQKVNFGSLKLKITSLACKYFPCWQERRRETGLEHVVRDAATDKVGRCCVSRQVMAGWGWPGRTHPWGGNTSLLTTQHCARVLGCYRWLGWLVDAQHQTLTQSAIMMILHRFPGNTFLTLPLI